MWVGIENFLILIILLVLAFDALLRLAEALFGLPNPFRKWKLEKEKERLEELGLLWQIPHHTQVARYLNSPPAVPVPNSYADLQAVLKQYTRDLGEPRPLGRGQQRVKARYFVDLNAPSASDLDRMAEILAQFISSELGRIDKEQPAITFSKLAIPHRGNPALGIALTRHDPFKSHPYTLIGDPAVQGWRFSGAKVSRGDTFILIDDLASSGSSLLSCVMVLRDSGIIINHAFVLVERTDASTQGMPTPSEFLRAEGVTLHAFWKGDDRELGRILSIEGIHSGESTA